MASVTAHEILNDLNEVIYSQGVRTAGCYPLYEKSLPWTLLNSNDYRKEDFSQKIMKNNKRFLSLRPSTTI